MNRKKHCGNHSLSNELNNGKHYSNETMKLTATKTILYSKIPHV